MLKYIDNFLNKITMYRLVLQVLIGLSILSIIFGFTGVIPYSGLFLIDSLIILISTSFFSNSVIAKLFKAPTNPESAVITALILFLILNPPSDISQALVIATIAVLAQASKYLLAKYKKHVFNPVAIALVIAGLSNYPVAIWWIGSSALFPFVLIAGLLVVRKLRRFDLFLSFIIASLLTHIIFIFNEGISVDKIISDALLPFIISTPLIFLGAIMLTEPITTPPKRISRIIYGIIVGILVIYQTPELSLIIGNVFAYIVSFKKRLILTLKEKRLLAPQIQEFIFTTNENVKFIAGQYFEWTLPHEKIDSRGARRYFTIASSPTEKEIRLCVRMHENSSSFKKALTLLEVNKTISAGSLAGEFTLPKNINIPIACIAGGIGITPFRSQIKEMIDTKTKRDLVLFYTALNSIDFVYTDIWREAKDFGVRTEYVLTDTKNVKPDWSGHIGFITKEMIEKSVPDYAKRIWYLSGPNMMVESYEKLLKNMGVKSGNVKTDYFPGF